MVELFPNCMKDVYKNAWKKEIPSNPKFVPCSWHYERALSKHLNPKKNSNFSVIGPGFKQPQLL